jgi:hypothetical protein
LLGPARELQQVLHDELVHVGELAGELDCDLRHLPGADDDLLQLPHESRLREDECVRAGRDVAQRVAAAIAGRRGLLPAEDADQDAR